MKKNISLSLDDLRVESFETLPELDEELILAGGACCHHLSGCIAPDPFTGPLLPSDTDL